MIRRVGEAAVPGQRYRRRPGVYAVILRGDSVLMTLQEAPMLEVQLPGGGIDRNEQPLPALHREVIEETGWRIAVTRRLGAFRRFTFMPEYGIWAEKLCTIYLAQAVRRLGPPTERGHHALWLPLDEATRLAGNAGDRMFLDGLRGRI